MRALVLSGPPGAGKTTVLTALSGLLEAADARHALVELEALAHVHPWPDDDAAFDHLTHVAASFRRRGYPLLLVAATIVDAAFARRLRGALPADEVVLARLEAPPALLRERIARREPPDWVGLPRLLAAVEALAAAHAALPGVDIVLSTADGDPRALAAVLRDALSR
jgi:broad-specificity NMP kinase